MTAPPYTPSGGRRSLPRNQMLGHATVAITLDLYSHVSPTMQRQAADSLDAVLA